MLRFVVGHKPYALVIDFFAGSGTTAHAVMRLNKQDGGRRRSPCRAARGSGSCDRFHDRSPSASTRLAFLGCWCECRDEDDADRGDGSPSVAVDGTTSLRRFKTDTTTTARNNPISAICAGDGLRPREER